MSTAVNAVSFSGELTCITFFFFSFGFAHLGDWCRVDSHQPNSTVAAMRHNCQVDSKFLRGSASRGFPPLSAFYPFFFPIPRVLRMETTFADSFDVSYCSVHFFVTRLFIFLFYFFIVFYCNDIFGKYRFFFFLFLVHVIYIYLFFALLILPTIIPLIFLSSTPFAI